MLVAGRAQVHVRVEERREQMASGAVDGLAPVRLGQRAGRAQLRDRPVAHDHVVGLVQPGAGVEDVRTGDQHCRRRMGAGHDGAGHTVALAGAAAGGIAAGSLSGSAGAGVGLAASSS